MNPGFFDRMMAARAAKRAVAIVTRIPDQAQCLVDGAECLGDLALSAEHREALDRRLVTGQSGMLDAEETLFSRVYVPPPRLLVVGAVHISQALAPMAAMAGFEVTVIDPRRAFASPDRFPDVTLLDDWPDDAMTRLAPDAQTAVVTLTHDPKLDDPALEIALRSPAFYIGSLGSTRTHEKRVARLTAAGLADQLPRIHAPVGLDLGGRFPTEIAISILAEIIRVRYKGSAR